MLKVAIILERADIALGGAERSVSELTAELRRQNVEATILAAKGTESEFVRILCRDMPSKRVRLGAFESAIKQHLHENRYDIIHSTLPLKIADIYQPRGGSYKETLLRNIASYPFSIQRLLKRWTHFLNVRRSEYINAEVELCEPDNSTVIAALSEYVREQFARHYQLSNNRIAVIPNGINPELHPDQNAARKIKDDIFNLISVPVGKTPILFLFAANNPRLKGLWSLLWAIKSMRNANIYPVLIIAGTKGPGVYRGLIPQFGLQHRVVSLGQQISIQNALSVCDIAVLPSYYDPCSRFILEALAMGKPVITTAFNGASERFEHCRHGYIIDNPDNINDVANAIAYFCNPEHIQLAQKAIIEDNLKDEVSIRKHVEQLVELYNTILIKKQSL